MTRLWLPAKDRRTTLPQRRIRALCVAFATALSLVLAVSCATDGDRRWVMGYYVGYLADRYPLDVVPWDNLTHIAVGAALPLDNGQLDTTFRMQDDQGRRWAKDVVRRAREHGVKAILMLGGEDTNPVFRKAFSPERRETFVRSVVQVVDEYGFDGVDIDWEPLTEEDVPLVLELAEKLRAERGNLLLTIPIASVNTNRPQDVPKSISSLAQSFDQVNLMTYGMHGAGWRDWNSWHPGALQGESEATPMSIESTVNAYVEAGLPAHKLGIGIGFYAACYRGITGPNQRTARMEVVADDNKMSYANVMDDYYSGSISHWDEEAKTPYLSSEEPFGPLQCTYVPYEDTRSIALKAEYAVNRGLGGAIIWNINQGYRPAAPDQEKDVLMETIWNRLGSR